EAVVNHPVRRRIVMTLILLGNVGVVTVLASLVVSFGNVDGSRQAVDRILVLALGLGLLLALSMSKVADRVISRAVGWALRRFTDLDVRDYVGLLHLAGEWVVGELEVEDTDWICDVPIEQLALAEEGIVLLGIERTDGRWVGAPNGEAAFRPGDVAVLYGRQASLDRIDRRTHDEAGEMDRIRAQIDFTEDYLDQQAGERPAAEQAHLRSTPHLGVGEAPSHRPPPDDGEAP
ncbi:MAG: TrkA C-terminal domain-containing protein, partial [Actinomycetota bacterium]